jgi:hypothetical protein
MGDRFIGNLRWRLRPLNRHQIVSAIQACAAVLWAAGLKVAPHVVGSIGWALNKSGDLLALLPQALRGRIVPSSRAWLDLAAIIEIAAADIGELRRTRETDDGVRAGLGRAGEHRL